MDCIKRLVIPNGIWVRLRDHIYDERGHEQLAGLIIRKTGRALRAVDIHILTEDHVIEAGAALHWDARFNIKLMKAARSAEGGVMLAHAHPRQKIPRLSEMDSQTAKVLFDFFGRELPGQINLMVVFGLRGNACAFADHSGRRYFLDRIATEAHGEGH
jgi:hypothetical protein